MTLLSQQTIETETNQFSWIRVLELTILFVIMPLLYVVDTLPVYKIIPLILLLSYCAVILIINKPMNISRFSMQANWKLIISRFVIITVAALLMIKFFLDLPLFTDLQQNRKLFYMILMYPILSVLPQEIIFREFFFYRYAGLFRSPLLLIIANILLFSFAHLYFGSWIVTIFTIVGGTIFSFTYRETRSLLVVSIEHTLYGLMILSSGLGPYFYKAF